MTQQEKTIRTFLAIDIPKEVKDAMGNVQYRLRDALKEGVIRWTKPDSVHLTIKFFGNISQRDIDFITGSLKDSVKTFRPFSLAAEKIGVFPNARAPRVLWLGITGDEALFTLQSTVEKDLLGAGFPREERAFRPHLTLGRTKAQRSIEGLAAVLDQYKDFKAGEFQAGGLTLYRSDLGSGGPVYSRLAQFPLGG